MGGGRDVAACFAPRIESLETDEGGGHAGVGDVFLSAKIGRIQEKNAECGEKYIAGLTPRAHDKEKK